MQLKIYFEWMGVLLGWEGKENKEFMGKGECGVGTEG